MPRPLVRVARGGGSVPLQNCLTFSAGLGLRLRFFVLVRTVLGRRSHHKAIVDGKGAQYEIETFAVLVWECCTDLQPEWVFTLSSILDRIDVKRWRIVVSHDLAPFGG